jgi:hypothetical protein
MVARTQRTPPGHASGATLPAGPWRAAVPPLRLLWARRSSPPPIHHLAPWRLAQRSRRGGTAARQGPLTIAARKDTGDPAAWSRLALWIDGSRFSGEALQWAFHAPPTDRNGMTTLQGLPTRPLDVLLWSPDPRISGLAEAGAYDSRRTTVAFPWPSVTTVTTVE